MKLIYNTAAIVVLAAAVTSCTKETVNAPYPYNELKTFTILTAAGDTIPAAISDSSIIVYWPYQQAVPDSITPAITVSDNATVSPASGAKAALKTGTAYTVKAETGATATYKIKLIVNQPEFSINSDQDVVLRLGDAAAIAGLVNVIPELDRTKIWLVSAKTGQETPVTLDQIEDLSANNYAARFALPAVDTGYYSLKINSGIYTVTSNKPYVRVIYPTPTFVTPTAAYNVQRGGTFTINGNNMRGILPGRARLTGGSVYYDLELVAFDLTHVTYRIPADYPLGNYNLLHLAYQTYTGVTGYIRVSSLVPVLTVTQ